MDNKQNELLLGILSAESEEEITNLMNEYKNYKPEPIRVIVYVRGGIVEAARATANIEFDVWDQDNIDMFDPEDNDSYDCRPAGIPDNIETWEQLESLYTYGVY